MTEIISTISEEGPLSLESISQAYSSSGEIDLCLIAFSRLEAEGLITQRSNGKWKVIEKDVS